jgi:hypothetical protein
MSYYLAASASSQLWLCTRYSYLLTSYKSFCQHLLILGRCERHVKPKYVIDAYSTAYVSARRV